MSKPAIVMERIKNLFPPPKKLHHVILLDFPWHHNGKFRSG